MVRALNPKRISQESWTRLSSVCLGKRVPQFVARFPSWCGNFGWMLKLDEKHSDPPKVRNWVKTEVKPAVSASESGDHLMILQPKNWKTQLKEDLVLPDLGERISKRYPRKGGFELSKTPQLRMTKDWTSLGGFTAKNRCPPKMFQTGMTCSRMCF